MIKNAPLRVLVAPDKFKGTLSSGQAARAISNGLKRAWPGVVVTLLPLTDGGEGFVEVMARQTGGETFLTRTVDAAGRLCRAQWGVLGDKKTAVVGISNASGLAMLPYGLRNPEATTNLGTGRIIRLALQRGYTKILVGLGGSATTEGGISLAEAALGYQFLDAKGIPIRPNGKDLIKLARIVPPKEMPKAQFTVATDVTSPLFGPEGAAHQFAPQKGANAAMVERLDEGLRHLAEIVKRDLGVDFAETPGAGAAGGCGYGMMAFFNAKQEAGFDLVRHVTNLDDLIQTNDLVVTGEGRFDKTSLHGKAPFRIAELAAQARRPVWAFCGRLDFDGSEKGTPFSLVAAVSTPSNPGPRLDSLTPENHAVRLSDIVFSNAKANPISAN